MSPIPPVSQVPSLSPPTSPAVPPGIHPGFVDSQEWMGLLAQRESRQLSSRIIDLLQPQGRQLLIVHDQTNISQIDGMVNLLLFVISHPIFEVPDDMAERFVGLNHTLASLVASSSLQTTDAHLEVIRNHGDGWVKIMALYSPRNRVRFDRQTFFDKNPLLASVWYGQYAAQLYSTISSELGEKNLRDHFSFAPERLIPLTGVEHIYYGASLVAPTGDRVIKWRINERIRQLSRLPERSGLKTDPRKIGVICRDWHKSQGVCKKLRAYFEQLRPKYHLTFIQVDQSAPLDAELFDEVLPIRHWQGAKDHQPLLHKDFHVIIYPDVGRSDDSILLANVRLAPIQLALMGHPVSTYGSEIDYFLSGAETQPPHMPERHYTERLVLMPGLGCIPEKPAYSPRMPAPAAGGRLVINCTGSIEKWNHGFLKMLARLGREAPFPLLFRFFIGGTSQVSNDMIPLYRQFVKVLGDTSFEIILDLPYDQYMAKLSEGWFGIDSYPFTGCAAVSDSLFAGVPMLSLEGEQCHSRIGGQLLRRAGLAELVTASEDQWVSVALKMMQTDGFGFQTRQKLLRTSLDGTLYKPREAEYLRKTIDYLVDNHDMLKQQLTRPAIRISG